MHFIESFVMIFSSSTIFIPQLLDVLFQRFLIYSVLKDEIMPFRVAQMLRILSNATSMKPVLNEQLIYIR